MNPIDRILAVCAEMRAAEEYGLVGPMQYGAWRQALEDVAAVLSCTKTAQPENDKARDFGLSG